LKLLIRTTNAILLDYALTLLRERRLSPVVFDQHMSLVEGSLGVLPRRIMIDEAQEVAARRLLAEAGLAHELAPEEEGPR